jgi:hypothetical protein
MNSVLGMIHCQTFGQNLKQIKICIFMLKLDIGYKNGYKSVFLSTQLLFTPIVPDDAISDTCSGPKVDVHVL